VIRIEQIVKRYGSGPAAVDGLSLEVGAGEIYALLGPNGAGKSSTIACVLGFTEPSSGRLVLCGDDALPAADAARRYAAYIAEQVALYDRLSGLENVDLFARLAGQRLSGEACGALLARAGLREAAWMQRCETYSKGMRQKVGIAIALAKRARVLVLDEPSSGLDPQAAVEFGQLLAGLAAEGHAVLMATHDLFRVQEVAHRCGILVGGRLVDERALSALAPGELEHLYLEKVRHG
jgi:ABC-2 type transport system ATP-binding protein